MQSQCSCVSCNAQGLHRLHVQRKPHRLQAKAGSKLTWGSAQQGG